MECTTTSLSLADTYRRRCAYVCNVLQRDVFNIASCVCCNKCSVRRLVTERVMHTPMRPIASLAMRCKFSKASATTSKKLYYKQNSTYSRRLHHSLPLQKRQLPLCVCARIQESWKCVAKRLWLSHRALGYYMSKHGSENEEKKKVEIEKKEGKQPPNDGYPHSTIQNTEYTPSWSCVV